MARITSKQAKELMEAYASVHNIQEQNRRVDIKSLDLSKPNGGMSDDEYNNLSSTQRNRIQNHMRLNKTKSDMKDAGIKSNEGPSTVSSVNDEGKAKKIDNKTTEKPAAQNNNQSSNNNQQSTQSNNNQQSTQSNNNQSQQKTVTKPFDKSKDIGGTSAIADKDKITPVSSTSRPGGGSITLPKGGFSKFAPKNNQQQSGGQQPSGGNQTQTTQRPAAQQQQQQKPAPQQSGGQKPGLMGRLGSLAGKAVGAARNVAGNVKQGVQSAASNVKQGAQAVAGALANKGPIQGRQTGAQRRAQQTGQPAPQAKPAPQAQPDAKPVPQAQPAQQQQSQRPSPMERRNARLAAQKNNRNPLKRPGAQRAMQMAKARLAASFDLFDDTVEFLVSEGHAKDKSEAMSIMSESEFIDAFNQELNG